jgi:hypothetical protein
MNDLKNQNKYRFADTKRKFKRQNTHKILSNHIKTATSSKPFFVIAGTKTSSAG